MPVSKGHSHVRTLLLLSIATILVDIPYSKSQIRTHLQSCYRTYLCIVALSLSLTHTLRVTPLNGITHLSLAHLLFLGGKEPKNRWVIMGFEYPAKENRWKKIGVIFHLLF